MIYTSRDKIVAYRKNDEQDEDQQRQQECNLAQHCHKRRRGCHQQLRNQQRKVEVTCETKGKFSSAHSLLLSPSNHANSINMRDNKRRKRGRAPTLPLLLMLLLSIAIVSATVSPAQQFNQQQKRRRQRQRNHNQDHNENNEEEAVVTFDQNPPEPILSPIPLEDKVTLVKEKSTEEFMDTTLVVEKESGPIVAVTLPAPDGSKQPLITPLLDLDEDEDEVITVITVDNDPGTSKTPPTTNLPDGGDDSNMLIIEKEEVSNPPAPGDVSVVTTFNPNEGDTASKPPPDNVPSVNEPAPGDSPVVTSFKPNDGEDGLEEDIEEDFKPPLLQDDPTSLNKPIKENIAQQPLKDDEDEALRACQSSSLSSPLEATTGSFGNVFNVRTPSNNPGLITITSLDFYTYLPEMVTYEVYTKQGSYIGHAGNLSAWTLISSGTTTGRGENETTPIPAEEFTSVTMSPDSTQGFYITLTSQDMRYRPGNGEPNVPDGMVQSFSEELELWEGAGVSQYPFGDLSPNPRQFLGKVNYVAEWKTCVPTSTPLPSLSPSTSLVPSMAPSALVVNATMPTAAPTTSASPSAIPTAVVTTSFMIKSRVRFEFYIWRPTTPSFDIEKVKEKIEISVENTLNDMLVKNESALASEHDLMVDEVASFGSDEPCSSGDKPKVCSTIVTNIILQHSDTLSTEEAEHLLFNYYDEVSSNLPFAVETVSTQAEIIISLAGVPTDRVMTTKEIYVFERAASSFLTDAEDFESNEVDILDVKVVGQALYVDGVMMKNTRSKDNDTEWVMASKESNNGGPSRRNLKEVQWRTVRRVRILNETDPTPSSKLDVFTMVTGAYVPPPEQNLPQLAVNSIDSDSEGFVKDLKEEASKEGVESVSNFFNNISGVEVMSEELAVENTPAPAPAPNKDGWNDNGAAKIVALAGGIVSIVLVVVGLVALRRWNRLRSEYDQSSTKECDTEGEENGEESNINIVDDPDSGVDYDNGYDDQGNSNPFDYDDNLKVPPQRSFKSQHSLRDGAGGLGVEDELLHHMFNKSNV